MHEGSSELHVSWDPPADDGGSAITGYKVTVDPDDAGPVYTNDTSTTITGLYEGETYTVTVSASNAGGDSPLTTTISATSAPAPDPPQNVTVSNNEVTWTYNDAAVDEFTITADSGDTTTDWTVGGQAESTSLAGEVTAFGEYTFTVTATNAGGSETSNPSAPVLVAGGEVTTIANAIDEGLVTRDDAISEGHITLANAIDEGHINDLNHAFTDGLGQAAIDEGLVEIGDEVAGGFFAGVIDTTQDNAVLPEDQYQTPLRYALIVSPRSLQTDRAYRTRRRTR